MTRLPAHPTPVAKAAFPIYFKSTLMETNQVHVAYKKALKELGWRKSDKRFVVPRASEQPARITS